MPLRSIISRNVRSLRLERGLTQQQLADKAKINVQHISRIERGGSNLTVDNLERLAIALKVPTPHLLSASLAAVVTRSNLDRFDDALRILEALRAAMEI